MDSIKDRLAHILRSKNLTASQFAEMMEIQPSNVSHLLNGRNKPSLDFLIKLKEVFPEYSFDWIILGRKPITMVDNTAIHNEAKQLNIDILDEKDEDSSKNNHVESIKSTDVKLQDTNNNVGIDDSQNCPNYADKPKKIIVFYDDDTFEMFMPRNNKNGAN